MSFTEKFFHFVENHWLLWLALVVILILLILEELRDKLSGVARLSPQELTQMINREEAVMVDLREVSVFADGHIINSINIPMTEFDSRIKSLEKHKPKAIILVDGGTSALTVITKLRNQGFKLYSLAGGINAWRAAGLPLSKK